MKLYQSENVKHVYVFKSNGALGLWRTINPLRKRRGMAEEGDVSGWTFHSRYLTPWHPSIRASSLKLCRDLQGCLWRSLLTKLSTWPEWDEQFCKSYVQLAACDAWGCGTSQDAAFSFQDWGPGAFPTVSHHVHITVSPGGCRLTLGPWMAELHRGSYLVPGDGPVEEDDPVCAFPKKWWALALSTARGPA